MKMDLRFGEIKSEIDKDFTHFAKKVTNSLATVKDSIREAQDEIN